MTIGMKNVLGLLNRKKMLTERQEALLEQERRQLTTLRDALERFGIIQRLYEKKKSALAKHGSRSKEYLKLRDKISEART